MKGPEEKGMCTNCFHKETICLRIQIKENIDRIKNESYKAAKKEVQKGKKDEMAGSRGLGCVLWSEIPIYTTITGKFYGKVNK